MLTTVEALEAILAAMPAYPAESVDVVNLTGRVLRQSVVAERGAALSHAIIVSRELGIPCVVSATDATKKIPDGATIEVNGDTGEVTVIELP